MRKELRQRLAQEYRYAANKMREVTAERKMFYFSVLFGEAQRILNFEWDRDLSLVHLVTQYCHTQITAQMPALGNLLPVRTSTIFENLTQITADLASYFEKSEAKADKLELHQILARFAEIAYIANGNGSFLFEKGFIELKNDKSSSK